MTTTASQIEILTSATPSDGAQWGPAEALGYDIVASYIVDGTYGVHAYTVWDDDGEGTTTYTVVYSVDGSEVSPEMTYTDIGDAFDKAVCLEEGKA